jgi:hypothetical protein
LTRLSAERFETLVDATRPSMRRGGAGRRFELSDHDQILLTVLWLRYGWTSGVFSHLFMVHRHTVTRTIARVHPLLERASKECGVPIPERPRRRRGGGGGGGGQWPWLGAPEKPCPWLCRARPT